MCTNIIKAKVNQTVQHDDHIYKVLEVTNDKVITELTINGKKTKYIFDLNVYESLVSFSNDFNLL